MTHDEASEKIAENVSKEVGIGPSADRYVIVMEKRTGKEKVCYLSMILVV